MTLLERLKSGIETSSAADTIELAKELESTLPEESVLTLEGDLGAGKTTFIKGIALGMGIQDVITSPTFNIFNTYRGPKTLLHMDAYRLEGSPKIIDELMLEDFMTPPYCLAIEWPGNLGQIPWTVTLSLHLSILPNSNHWIRTVS
jgi:tRNA threonylcarbamoyladenosine biosynthesis protein TsaE